MQPKNGKDKKANIRQWCGIFLCNVSLANWTAITLAGHRIAVHMTSPVALPVNITFNITMSLCNNVHMLIIFNFVLHKQLPSHIQIAKNCTTMKKRHMQCAQHKSQICLTVNRHGGTVSSINSQNNTCIIHHLLSQTILQLFLPVFVITSLLLIDPVSCHHQPFQHSLTLSLMAQNSPNTCYHILLPPHSTTFLE